MLRNNGKITSSVLMLLDVVLSTVICLALLQWPEVSGMSDPFAEAGASLLLLAITACLVWPFTFQQLDVYSSVRTLGAWDVTQRLFVSGCVVATILGAIAFATDVPISRSFPFVCAAAQGLALSVMRFGVYSALRTARRVGRNTRNVLIVGSGARAAQAKRNIDANPSWGLRVLGFVDDVDTAVDPSLFNAKMFGIKQMPDLLSEMVVDRVLVAVPRSMLGSIAPVLSSCSSTGIPLTLLTDLFGDYMPTPQIGSFGSRPSLEFAAVHHNSFLLGVKRTIDLFGSAIALLFSAPIIALAALAIWIEDRGPIFFTQKRCGLYGHQFPMIKLRTMCADAEGRKADLVELNEMDGPVFKVKHDPRITRVGAFLRRYSLDELPNFLNVLSGDMSVVGPRPEMPFIVETYGAMDKERLRAKPGVTGLWQISYARQNAIHDNLDYDLYYIENQSLLLDLVIIALTSVAVMKGTGAY